MSNIKNCQVLYAKIVQNLLNFFNKLKKKVDKQLLADFMVKILL
jgi:hypothetical protein